MKKYVSAIAAVMACVMLSGPGASATTTSVDELGFTTSPPADLGKRWRIGYYEGGEHSNYRHYLTATIEGLMRLGWIEERELPLTGSRSTEALWRWLVENARSDYLEFVPDAYYTANWDARVRTAKRSEIIDRLRGMGDLDLMIAMGTWAGKDLASPDHDTPVVVMSSSDPVGAGIVASMDDSGLEHVHARVDPTRYERQLRVFHDIIGFKRLGVAYENSVAGKSYAAIELIEKVAAERGFEIIRCYTKSDIADQEAAGQSVVGCFKQLVRDSDAIYVTVQGGVNAATIPHLVKLANENRVPTFSQLGSEEVRNGFLLSISRAGGFKPVGLFLAATITKIFNGAHPRQLTQIFEESPNIAINLKTAELVGLYLYADVLAAADEIYRDITPP